MLDPLGAWAGMIQFTKEHGFCVAEDAALMVPHGVGPHSLWTAAALSCGRLMIVNACRLRGRVASLASSAMRLLPSWHPLLE